MDTNILILLTALVLANVIVYTDILFSYMTGQVPVSTEYEYYLEA
jgi:hypothetical protein